jgi:polyphenol oxidase
MSPDLPFLRHVELGVADGWFSGRHLPGIAEANLSHHRPHDPARLASARAALATATGTDALRWHLMRQVHGAEVAVVGADTPAGAELTDVDGVVTRETDRALVVLTADCVPVLLAGRHGIGAVHAGWRGVVADVVGAAVAALRRLGEAPQGLTAAVGPAIGPCCYEVGAEVVAAVTAVEPGAAARTTWGSTAVDLPGAVTRRLLSLGVRVVGTPAECTRCGSDVLFSHRADPDVGRQAGLVVRHGGARS